MARAVGLWLVLALLSSGLVLAQQDAQAPITINLRGAQPVPAQTWRFGVDWRVFPNGSPVWTLDFGYSPSSQWDIGVNYCGFSSTGEDYVAFNPPLIGPNPDGDLVHSELQSWGVNARWTPTAWVTRGARGGLELGVEVHGRSRAIQLQRWWELPEAFVAVSDDHAVFTFRVPWTFEEESGVVLCVEPRAAFFTEKIRMHSLVNDVPNYGAVFGLGLGFSGPLGGGWRFVADATPILHGDNTIDTDTGGVARALPWAAGVRWERAFASDDWTMDLYATSALGRTAATSLLVAPADSTAMGLSLTYQH